MDCLLKTPRALDWLENGRSARILHIFDSVVNLAAENGAVLSLASPGVAPGPFSLVLNQPFQWHEARIKIDDAITADSTLQILTIGSLEITTAQARTWNPIPDWSQLKNYTLLDYAIPDHMPWEIEAPFQQLLEAIGAEDRAAARSAVHSLAGLGGGLTPAGDDLLMGLLFAFWVWAPQSGWINAIVEWAASRTTTLSAAYLRAAGAGEATQHWHDLISGQPGALERLLAIGHTSGKDAWAGFLIGCRRFITEKEPGYAKRQ